MPDFGPYTFYIVGAYTVAGVSISTLLLVTLYDLRMLTRKLDEIEKT